MEKRVEPNKWSIADAINQFWLLTEKRAAYMHREGFYPYRESSQLPVPIPREKAWKGEREFREALVHLEGSRQTTRIEVEGRDECLLCDAKLPRTEFWVLGQWKWTSAFYHYVKEHHVRPCLGFQEFVLGRGIS